MMICPRCESSALVELDRQGITIDRCETCRGVWLDRGELEKLIARETQPVAAERPRDDRDYRDAGPPGEPPRRYRRPDSDDGDDDRRYHGKKRSSWWDIFD